MTNIVSGISYNIFDYFILFLGEHCLDMLDYPFISLNYKPDGESIPSNDNAL